MNEYIFISYAHKDFERVKPIIETIKKTDIEYGTMRGLTLERSGLILLQSR